MKRLAVGAALVLACVTGTTTDARADDAEQTFQLGLAAMKKKDYPTACGAFAQSNISDPSPGTQINLALCFEKRKMWASAWSWYRSAVNLAHVRGQKDREQLADDSSTKLLPQIHYVLFVAKEPLVEPKALRDGEPVTIALNGKEVPVPVDPGEHTFEVTAKGKKPWTTTVKAPDNNRTDRIEVPVLENAPVEVAPAVTAPPSANGTGVNVSDYRPPATGHEGSGQRVAGVVVGAAGVLAGLASVGLFVLASSTARDRDQNSADKRLATSEGRTQDAQSFEAARKSKADATSNNRLIGYTLVGGGVVLLGVGTVLFLTSPKPQKTGITRLLPELAPGHAGLSLGGSF